MVLIKAPGLAHGTMCGPFQSDLPKSPPCPRPPHTHILGNSFHGPALGPAAQAFRFPGPSQSLLLGGANLHLEDGQEPPECVGSERCLLHLGRRASLSTRPWSKHLSGVQYQAGWQWGWPKDEQGIQDTRQWVEREKPIHEESRAMWTTHVGPPAGQAFSV